METIISKELRVLGIVIGILSSFSILCSNTDFSFQKAKQDSFLILYLLARGCPLVISALEHCVFIAVLVLLRRDVKVCNSSVTTAVIVLASISLVPPLIQKILVPVIVRRLTPESPPDNAPGSGENKVENGLLSKMFSCFLNKHEVINNFFTIFMFSIFLLFVRAVIGLMHLYVCFQHQSGYFG